MVTTEVDKKPRFFSEGVLSVENAERYAALLNQRLHKGNLGAEIKRLAELCALYFEHTDTCQVILDLYEDASKRSGDTERYEDKKYLFDIFFKIWRQDNSPVTVMAQFDEMYSGVVNGKLVTIDGSPHIIRTESILNLREKFQGSLATIKEAIEKFSPNDSDEAVGKKTEALAHIDKLTEKAEALARLIEDQNKLPLKMLDITAPVSGIAGLDDVDSNAIEAVRETGQKLLRIAKQKRYESMGADIAKAALPDGDI